MADRSFTEQIILDEIAGKNNAIHAYDRIIWTIRSGFLVLVFGGWGILLKGLIGQETTQPSVFGYIFIMLMISIGLALGGFLMDLSYVRRKFRVIAALNKLMKVLMHCDKEKLELIEFRKKKLLPSLKVAGAASTKSYKIPGYSGALTAGALIYSIPLIALGISVFVLFLLPN